MIKCTKRMKRNEPEWAGKCQYCTSEFSAEGKDLKIRYDPIDGNYVENTECSVCGKTGQVRWEETKEVSYSPVTQTTYRDTDKDDLNSRHVDMSILNTHQIT